MTPFPLNMGFDVPASLPTTPTEAQQPLWALRQPFDPQLWSSGVTLVDFPLPRSFSDS